MPKRTTTQASAPEPEAALASEPHVMIRCLESRTASLAEGRTTQPVVAGETYRVPASLAQAWIAEGWAEEVTDHGDESR